MRTDQRITRSLQRLLLGGVAALGLCVVNAAEPTYDFGTTPNVIDIGYGILATPMSVLGETLRRDQVLRKMAAKQGFEFRFHRFEKGSDTIRPLHNHQLDASMPTDVVALELLAHTDVLLLGYVRHSFSSVIAARGMSMTGLRGKRVGNAPGTSGHNAMLQGLAAAGMTETDVIWVSMNVREMPEALLAGQIDAFAAFEPTPSTFLKTHGGRYVPLHRQVSPAYLLSTREMADRQPEAAHLLVAALHRAVRWLGRSRANLEMASQWTLAEMQNFTGKKPGMEVRDIALLTHSDLLDISGVPLIQPGESRPDSPLGRSFDFLHKAGKLPASMVWAQVVSSIDSKINRAVLGNLGGYRVNEFDYTP